MKNSGTVRMETKQILEGWIKSYESKDFYTWAIARITGICNNNAVERSFLRAHSAQSDLYCHIDVHLQNRIILSPPKVLVRSPFKNRNGVFRLFHGAA